MVYNIINWVNWQRPLYFAVTVARENMAGLDDYLSMEGMVYRISRTKALPGDMLVNVPVLDDNIFNRYMYRGLVDPNNYIPPNTKHLVTNYFIGFAQLAERYANRGDTKDALRAAQGAIEKTPSDLPKRTLLYQVLCNGKMYDAAKEFIAKEMKTPEWAKSSLPERLSIYALLERSGDREKAYSLVQAEQDKSKSDTSKTGVWQQYIVNLYTLGDFAGTLAALDKVLEINPNDQTMKETRDVVLQQIRARNGSDSSASGVKP
jgi:tetratricopeptide (TPR) repeat protein